MHTHIAQGYKSSLMEMDGNIKVEMGNCFGLHNLLAWWIITNGNNAYWIREGKLYNTKRDKAGKGMETVSQDYF